MKATPQEFLNQSVPFYKNRKFVAPTLALIVTIITILSRTYLDVEFSSNELISLMVGLWGITGWIVKMDGDYDKARLQSDVTDKFETFTQIAELLGNSGILDKAVARASSDLVRASEQKKVIPPA